MEKKDESKFCAGCGKEISRMRNRGHRIGDLAWMRKKFCSNECRLAAKKKKGFKI